MHGWDWLPPLAALVVLVTGLWISYQQPDSESRDTGYKYTAILSVLAFAGLLLIVGV